MTAPAACAPLLLVLLTACGGSPPRGEEAPRGGVEPAIVREDPTPEPTGPTVAEPTPAEPLPFELPAEWDTLGVPRFEQALEAWLPPGRTAALEAEALDELAAALERQDETSVRAAVILARSRDPEAGAVLLARLEQGVTGPARNSDAGDVVAAAALGGWSFQADVGERLERLSHGDGSHPDLEVRVECARGALAFGRDGVVPFLLAVLRTHTPDRDEAREDWAPQQTMAWAKSRAAEALSARAGVPCVFQADGSYADQAAEARRLEELCAGKGGASGPGGAESR